jgi:hypothetical protein
MYDQMHEMGMKTDQKERKLTMLLSTQDTYMSFSTYYLWFLIDYCHLIIDDVKSIITFAKHDSFNPFVTEFMNKRIECIKNKSSAETFYKLCLNGSYGYDGMNTEKYQSLRLLNKDKTYEAHLYPRHINTRKIGDDNYMVASKPKWYPCKTCIQEAYFTLDNAKFWYLNFIYNFMYKCMDRKRFHFIEGDTDSAYWAISGDPTDDYKQGFKHIITDQEFYDQHIESWLGTGSLEHQKQLLGLAIEKQDENCVALSPKCYTLFPHCRVTKMKGVSKSKNKVVSEDYNKCLLGEVIKGININLQMVDYQMSKVTVHKNALTACNTKNIPYLINHACRSASPLILRCLVSSFG